MSTPATSAPIQHHAAHPSGWRELWLKEDWWAVWLGLGIVLVAYALFARGHSLEWIAVSPAKWSDWSDIANHFAASWPRYIAQFALWAALFSVALRALGYDLRQFLPAFLLVYLFAVLIFTLGQWSEANRYNLEPPLVALALGLVISNVVGLPAWLDAGFRVEFYVKTGIVLLGATLPFTLIAR
ncbi:MAG: putative sulfate exporter family transporter [Steroidobacteraceae bacterium]